MKTPDGPVLIELGEADEVAPERAPLLPDTQGGGAAMQVAAQLAARRSSRLTRWFWGILGALLSFGLSLAAWDFVARLMIRSPALGAVALGLIGLLVVILLTIALREWLSFVRFARLDRIQHSGTEALASHDLAQARAVANKLEALYRSRPDTEWGRSRLTDQKGDIFDADALLGLAEQEILVPLDLQARREIEAAARQVATVTAIVPLALADVAVALTANLRMIRRIAEIYGGRAGTLGSWRLTRNVLTHLVATGAVAVGDDLIGSIAGGGLVSKLSRRFGEGVINGALTARVGVAAMEVCRPLPFIHAKHPSVAAVVKHALAGVFRPAAPPENR